MSFAGFQQFNENLITLTNSDAFKKATEGERLEMSYRLLNSPCGNNPFGLTKKLQPKNKNLNETKNSSLSSSV